MPILLLSIWGWGGRLQIQTFGCHATLWTTASVFWVEGVFHYIFKILIYRFMTRRLQSSSHKNGNQCQNTSQTNKQTKGQRMLCLSWQRNQNSTTVMECSGVAGGQRPMPVSASGSLQPCGATNTACKGSFLGTMTIQGASRKGYASSVTYNRKHNLSQPMHVQIKW